MSQYLMDQMDPTATQRRIDQATEAGRRAMDRALERTQEIDKAAAEEGKRRQQMLQDAKDESARKEAERVARRDAAEAEKKPQSPWAPREGKATVLSFGDDEAPAHQPAPAPQAWQPPPPSAPPQRYLSFGGETDPPPTPQPLAPQPPAPEPPRRPAPPPRPAQGQDDEDDWSGRSWMRR